MVIRFYKNPTQLVFGKLQLVKLGSPDDWGCYGSKETGRNEFGTPLMLRGPKHEIIDFLADRDLTGNLELEV